MTGIEIMGGKTSLDEKCLLCCKKENCDKEPEKRYDVKVMWSHESNDGNGSYVIVECSGYEELVLK